VGMLISGYQLHRIYRINRARTDTETALVSLLSATEASVEMKLMVADMLLERRKFDSIAQAYQAEQEQIQKSLEAATEALSNQLLLQQGALREALQKYTELQAERLERNQFTLRLAERNDFAGAINYWVGDYSTSLEEKLFAAKREIKNLESFNFIMVYY
jgi:hypothetical protein